MAEGSLIVTGASRGIGAAIAVLAAARGWSVCVNYARRREAADAVAARIRAAGGRAIAHGADVSDEAAVAGMFARTERELGPVRGLVNNAAVPGGGCRVEALEAAALRRVLDVNVVGTFLCAREAVRRMSTRTGGAGGAIVNISSAAARLGGAGELVAYGASKAAVETFTLGLAIEVAAEGIRVNAVQPGPVRTEIHDEIAPPGVRLARMTAAIPMGRPGEPEEIAQSVLFLLGPESSFTTGAVLTVSGGR